MPFTPGNRTPCVFSPRAAVYKVGAAGGTVTLPRQFKRLGVLLATDPNGANVVAAQMVAPSAAGMPQAALTIADSAGAAATGDVLIIQV
jgi:hypothetical protein